MNVRRKFAVLAATLALAVCVPFALAAVVTGATGPIKINGKVVQVEPGTPIQLNKGDVVDAGSSSVTITTEAGDEIRLDPGSVAESYGVEDGIDGVFLKSGSATASLSQKSTVGVGAGWVQPDASQTGKIQVFLEAPAEQGGREGFFRAISGDALIRYRAYSVFLPERHSVSLTVDPDRPNDLGFRTAQQNSGDILILKQAGGGTIETQIPKATSGLFELVDGTRTRIANDVTSLKSGRIVVTTRYGGNEQQAFLGPGTYALVDNATGAIQVVFTAVEFEILERAITLTSEFSTLAQSNFSDVD